jgi:hypothetical protein
MSATTRGLSGVVLALSLACSSGNETPAPAFGPADLAGEWDALQLASNSSPGWAHTHLRVAADGSVTLLSILRHDGPGTLPSTIDQRLAITADGIVTMSGADALPSFHGSMTSKKTLMFATLTEGNGALDLLVIRKRVAGLAYSAADVAGVALTIDHQWDRNGPVTSPPPPGFATLTIDAAGVVGLAGAAGVMSGVMSADKKSLFLLQTTDPGSPLEVQLIVVTLSRGGFASADLAGQYGFHLLTSGATTAASSWSRGTFGINAQGLVTFATVLNSGGNTTPPSPFTLAIDAGGSITRPDDPSFHGQLAWNGDFYVRTGNATGNPVDGVMVLSSR